MAKNAFLVVYLFATTTFCAELSPSTFNFTVGPPPRRHAPVVRPFYIIGHMVNSLEEVGDYLAQGSNALEADIEFAVNGSVIGTYHGVPCDCFRNCGRRVPIAVYLQYIRDMTAWRGFASQNHNVVMRDAVEDGSRNFDHFGVL